MKNLYLALVGFVLILSSCGGNSSVPVDAHKQALIDESIIQAYIKTNHIPAVKDSSGLYYQVLKPGTGATATAASTVQVYYEGKLPDGSVFDKTTGAPATFPLNGVIPGWTKGIPLIKAGGQIQLFIPSALGYGQNAAGPIPANSVLIFTISLLNVQ